jgi:molybdopterin-synthase adenylyltransferase
MLSDEELLRYSRQIMLQQIDIAGQQTLRVAHVLVLGAGGLGSPVLLYLAAAGIGQLTIVDDDQVDSSNLQRQIIHQESTQGIDKVESAKQRIKQINPSCKVNTISQRLDLQSMKQVLSSIDLVVDCCDNFTTRFMLNEVCWQSKTPLVSGAAIRWEGQLTTFLMKPDSACYACLYDTDSYTDQSCSENGVLGPIVGTIGSLQALEAIKVLSGAGKPLAGCLMLFDGMDQSFSKIKFNKKKDCSVCSK